LYGVFCAQDHTRTPTSQTKNNYILIPLPPLTVHPTTPTMSEDFAQQAEHADVINSALSDSAHREKKVVYVGNIREDATQEQLRILFIPFGPITQVQIPLDYKSQRNKGFGFVSFEDRDDAAHARENMHNAEFQGRHLNVAVARPIRVKLGSSTAVWSHVDGAGNLNDGTSSSVATDAMQAMDTSR